jgi:hypothetical protein
MAYKKFDDPNTKVDDSRNKINDNFMNSAVRLAIQGIANRVLGGTSGTGSTVALAGCAAGGTVGFKTASDVAIVHNGVYALVAAKDNLYFGTCGTLAANTVAKFLICSVDGGAATNIGPGNVVSKADYASATLAAAAAKLPDLPSGGVALGYVTLHAPALTQLVLTDGATTAAARLGYGIGAAGTTGTATYVDLMNMPLNL